MRPPAKPALSRASALSIIRSLEAEPKAFASLVLCRGKDPRWAEWQRAYAALHNNCVDIHDARGPGLGWETRQSLMRHQPEDAEAQSASPPVEAELALA